MCRENEVLLPFPWRGGWETLLGLKPETTTFSQRYQLWWKPGRALFPDWFPNTWERLHHHLQCRGEEVLAWDVVERRGRPLSAKGWR